MKIKALTIKEPWLSLIAAKKKTIETRDRKTGYRGPILLCSSQNDDSRYAFIVREHLDNNDANVMWPRGIGYVTSNLVDCRPMEPGDAEAACCEYIPGLWALVLEDIKSFDPYKAMSVSGMPGMFEVEIDEFTNPELFRSIKKMVKKKVVAKGGLNLGNPVGKSAKKKEETKSTGDGLSIETKARLINIEIKSKNVKIKFKDIDLRADQVRRISIWTKEGEPLFVKIDGNIGTEAKMNKCITSRKGNELQFSGMNFSSRQCEQLAEIVKSEAEIMFKVQADTNSLFAEEDSTTDPK